MTSPSKSEKICLPKISIAKILPKVSQQELYSRKKCYLGISLENPAFEGDSLLAMLLWVTSKFEKCLVIVGDHLCRFNEQIINGPDNSLADKLAEKLGDSFIKQTKGLFSQLPAKKFKLTRWKEHLHTEQFKKAKIIIDELSRSNEDFNSSVKYDAQSFVGRLKKRHQNMAVDMEEAINLSCKYILEEVAVFSSLSEQGWTVELYPGSELRVLVEVANGKYPSVPKGLKTRVNVELKIHRQVSQ